MTEALPGRGRRPAWARQGGQALVEAVVALSALALVYAAVLRVGAWQEAVLQASHASRHAAFLLARQAPEDAVAGEGLRAERSRSLPDAAQPGGRDEDAGALRRDWAVQDAGIVRAAASRRPAAAADLPAFPGTGRGSSWQPVFVRHTAILAGAGHAPDDGAVQRRVAGSATAWRNAADRSVRLGRRIRDAVADTDAPWGRPAPEFDWLSAWAGRVPERLLEPRRSGAARR